MGLPFTRSLPVRLVLFLTLLLTPLAIQVAHAEEWITYTDKEAGFSVSYPADWEITTKSLPRAEIRMEAPGGEAPTRCAFGYERQDGMVSIDPKMWLESHLSGDLFLEVYREKYDEVVLVKTHMEPWAGQAAAFIEASYLTRPREDRDAIRYWTRLTFARDQDGVYDSRCVVPEEDSEKWGAVLSRIVVSFRVP
jgi:hypothetical protein